MNAKLGRSKVLMFRLFELRGTESAKILALQTSHSISYSTDELTANVKTIDGNSTTVKASGATNVSVSIDYIKSDDVFSNFVEEAVERKLLVEAWEIDLATKTADGKYSSKYMQGYIPSIDIDSDVDSFSTASITLNVNALPQKGLVELTQEQEDNIQYVFTDLKPVTEPEGE